MKTRLRLWGPPLILLSAALLLFFSGLLDEHPVFANFDSRNMKFESKRREAALEKGDDYGVIASEGPHFNLDPGEYRLKWSVYADGENAFRLSFANGARIEPAELIMPEGVEDGEFVFSVLEPGVDLSVKADFQEGTHLTLLFLRLYLPAQKDRAWTFLALCTALSALWIMRESGRLNRKDAAAWVFLAGMLFVACAPALRGSAGVWENQNGMREMVQADQIAQAIRSGNPGAPLHHGYPDERETTLSIARPDVFLLPWALMRLSGASAAYTLNCWMMTIHILCTAAAYAAAKACGLRRDEAVLCAVLVTAAPWRISAVYMRGAFRELASLTMICLCLWMVTEKRHGRTAFCAAAFLASPALGAMFWIALIIRVIAGFIGKKKAFSCWFVLRAVLLCAFQWIPMLFAGAGAWLSLDWMAVGLMVLTFAGAVIAAAVLARLPERERNAMTAGIIGMLLLILMPELHDMIRKGGIPARYGTNPEIRWDGFGKMMRLPKMLGILPAGISATALAVCLARWGHGFMGENR